MDGPTTRKPAVAGQFYPRVPDELRALVRGYLELTDTQAAPDAVAALVAPHAGYMYSGPTAGQAFARVKGKKPRRVVLLGVSHRYHFEGASVYQGGGFDTPLGAFPIDDAFAADLARKTDSGSAEPHLLEHSLEVQLPFVAEAIGEVPIVPILLGSTPDGQHARLGETLARMTDETDLVIASTDLSHYLPEEEANQIDKVSLDTVLSQDWRAFAEGIANGTCSMCGAAAVVVAMTYALERGAKSWALLDYRTSAETSGDYDRVVGYGAISMERAA
ncbi:MAG TPA: AmmeMemoRadiSam system protein B [Candidatus Hydrogenedentes bacterium]|nr:AmmeMemoRadiSam system protein B [Candidatus Hydrogenedentota bacterium]